MSRATDLYGPNGDAVAELIERCKTLTREQATQLQEAWDALPYRPWEQAFDAAFDAARAAARDSAWDAVRDAVRAAAWAAVRDSAWDAAGSAAGDAAVALVARDLITPEQFNLLYGPWASVMEVDGE